MKGAHKVGKAATKKEDQIQYLRSRLNMFLEVLDAIEPETADVDDIDRLIAMLDDLEGKYERFKKDWEN
nr:SE1561 family protein [Bacillus kexueae]